MFCVLIIYEKHEKLLINATMYKMFNEPLLVLCALFRYTT